jgi:hypothetical protein
MDAVALQEIDEALLLRPGDAEAAALRGSILAALNPPAATPEAEKLPPVPESESVARNPEAEHALPLIDLSQAALALVPGDAGHLPTDWQRWRELVLTYLGRP